MKTPRSRKTYSLGDVMRLTGAKRPQIEYWVRKGIVHGEFEDGGTGLPRQFVFRNLVEVAFALELNLLGVNTDVMDRMVDTLRYGDIETDVRTPGYVAMMRQPPPRLTKAQRREAKAAFEKIPWRPLEERCCAELNDDGTIKLLRLLRAYVDAGVGDAEIRKGLLGVAREHLRQHQQWQKEFDALHRRWLAFKNPVTRPRTSQFWVVCGGPDPREDPEDRWHDFRLTDDRDKQHSRTSRAVIVVTVRPILERLESETGDSWPATPERKVFKVDEPVIPARQLVAQAFREYELTEEHKARAAAQPPAETVKEQSDVST